MVSTALPLDDRAAFAVASRDVSTAFLESDKRRSGANWL
jgi:hypothetical protein